ncbi:MAG: metallophosphoesterase [Lentisphaeria bacterium]|nr:metallophosphoesterase [Lentisphaeria bacterium]
MKLERIRLPLGLPEPVTILHVSDTHFCRADARDGQRKIDLAAIRLKYEFGRSMVALDPDEESLKIERRLDELFAYGKANCDLVIHTGDFIDFRSIPNLEAMGEKLRGADAFYTVGSHEFSLYMGEAEENTAYKMQSWEPVSAAAPNPLDFAVRIVKGVRFIGMDNSYYRFTGEQAAALDAELRAVMPTVICVHTPIFEDSLFRRRIADTKLNYTSLVAIPDRYRLHFPEDQAERLKPDAATMEMYRLIVGSPQIKAILAGHLHRFYRNTMPGGAVQICVGAGFLGEAAELTLF